MPNSSVFVEIIIISNVGQMWKILVSTQNKHKPTLKTADSGCKLTDDRSHKVRYNDPVVGNFHIYLVIQAYTLLNKIIFICSA